MGFMEKWHNLESVTETEFKELENKIKKNWRFEIKHGIQSWGYIEKKTKKWVLYADCNDGTGEYVYSPPVKWLKTKDHILFSDEKGK